MFLALSVTNYFNIVSAKRTIDAIRANAQEMPLIVVGGNAFVNNSDVNEIGADKYLQTYEDIAALTKEVQ